MEVSALAVPETLYARFAKLGYNADNWEDAVNNLYGNPNGMGVSAVPYVYCLTEEERDRTSQRSVYYLKLQFKWPSKGKFADESHQQQQQQTYDTYFKCNFLGAIRQFRKHRRHVVFEPLKYLASITDVVKGTTLLIQESVGAPEEIALKQSELQELMNRHLGTSNIHPQRDYFCISEIARRSRKSPARVSRDLCEIIGRIQVHPASGCWRSSRRNDYKRTFWLALGGLQLQHLYYFPLEDTDDPKPLFVKDRYILHSQMCELTLGRQHAHCCRPSHLKIGTAAENAVHIKIRKNIEQLFDLTPDLLREYSSYIGGIARIVQLQQQVMTTEEEKVHKRRKAVRVTYWENLATNEQGIYKTPEGQEEVGLETMFQEN